MAEEEAGVPTRSPKPGTHLFLSSSACIEGG
eukprot:COSAG06_NODE_66938_length_253_cov_0.668831_1_plen_30_part_01